MTAFSRRKVALLFFGAVVALIGTSAHLDLLFFEDTLRLSFSQVLGPPAGLEEGEVRPKVHPIVGLMRDAETRWNELYSKQSSTLEEAVAEYERRYGLPPPAGFHIWFAYTRNASVHFVDEFDALHETMTAFRGLSPENLREQTSREGNGDDPKKGAMRMFKIWVKDGVCGGEYEESWPEKFRDRSGWEVCYAMRDVEHLLPDVPSFLYSTSDEGAVTLSWAEKERFRELARLGEASLLPPSWTPTDYFSAAPSHYEHVKENGYVALAQSCPPDSPARSLASVDPFSNEIMWEDSSSLFSLPIEEGGFVFDAEKAIDVCSNTQLRQGQGILLQWTEMSKIIKGSNHTPYAELRPIFSQSKFSIQSDILIPQLYGYLGDKTWEDVPWEDRENKFIWRGAMTGVYYAGSHTIGGDWREAQRQTLHRFCVTNYGFLDYVSSTNSSLGNLLRKGTMKRRFFAEKFLDCGASSSSTCGYDNCDMVNKETTFVPARGDYSHFKFVGDVDGMGWSGRFRDLLNSKSVVVKATAFPEWFSATLTPWYHYVPMKYDYLDLPNILAFFLGAPDTHEGEHDEMARQIGLNGKRFVDEHWRQEDIASYIWRVMLEYRRLYLPEGEGDFHL